MVGRALRGWLAAGLVWVVPLWGYAQPQITITVTGSGGTTSVSGGNNDAPVDFIDFSTLGKANDPGFDNTPKLVEALQRRVKPNGAPAATERCVIYIPAGKWYFLTPIPVNTHAQPAIFDNVVIHGAGSGAVQLWTERGLADDWRRTVLICNYSSESNVFWAHQRAAAFGPLEFRGFKLFFTNRGSGFDFGDINSVDGNVSTLRGLIIDDVTIERQNSWAGGNGGGIAPWRATGADGTTLNRNADCFGLRMTGCYDVRLDVGVWGWKHGVINNMGDRVHGRVRAMICGMGLLETGIPGATAPVGSHWSELFVEHPLLAGVVLCGQAAMVRVESNTNVYPGIEPGLIADIPATVTWSVAAGGTYVNMTFPGAKNCLDYFEPWCYYRFTPTTAGEPPLEVLCEKVEANRVYFGGTNKNYVARAIAGNGTGIGRYFGEPLIAYGSRADIASMSLGINDMPGMPYGVVAPASAPLRIPGNSNGRGDDANEAQNLRVVARCAGEQEGMWGGVDLMGSAGYLNHPLINPGGIGPRFNRIAREALWDPFTRGQVFTAGRGTSSFANSSRNATFHQLTDEDGNAVWGVRPSDATFYYLRPLYRAGVATTYKLHLNVPIGTATAAVHGGRGNVNSHFLNTGWNTVNGTLGANQMLSDVSGPFITLSGSNYYFESAVVTQ